MKINNTFARYILTGGANSIFGYSVFALFEYVGVHYYISILLGTVAGILFNFKTLGSFVFKNNSARLIWKFLVVYSMLYVINVILVNLFMPVVHNIYLATAVAIVITAVLGYYLNGRYVYSK